MRIYRNPLMLDDIKQLISNGNNGMSELKEKIKNNFKHIGFYTYVLNIDAYEKTLALLAEDMKNKEIHIKYVKYLVNQAMEETESAIPYYPDEIVTEYGSAVVDLKKGVLSRKECQYKTNYIDISIEMNDTYDRPIAYIKQHKDKNTIEIDNDTILIEARDKIIENYIITLCDIVHNDAINGGNKLYDYDLEIYDQIPNEYIEG